VNITSRKAALAAGLNRYFTGKPCTATHIAERFVNDGTCVVCKLEKNAAWDAANPEKRKAYSVAWRAANPEKNKASNAAWYAANSDKEKARSAAYREANPEKNAVKQRNRQALKRAAEGSHTAADVQRIYEAQKGKCVCCHKKLNGKYHVDHIQPLARGGSNWPDNLQALCPTCNMRKSAKDPIKFAQENGRLL
jgi:5-methylcytosine-specific restriction endonuclease McrA